MYAFHVYFNPDVEKFELTTEKVELGVTNDFSHYFVDPNIAEEAVKRLNTQVSTNLRRCKDCGRYYWITGAEKHWYSARNLHEPVRCNVCRKINTAHMKEVEND